MAPTCSTCRLKKILKKTSLISCLLSDKKTLLDSESDFDDEMEPRCSSLPTEEDIAKQHEEFEAMIRKAREGEHGEELEALVQRYKDVFTSEYSLKPAKVAPMVVELKEDMHPSHTSVRRYRPEQKKFLDDTLRKLVDKGLLEKVDNAEWLSAPHLVEKPLGDGKSTFRLTIDLVVRKKDLQGWNCASTKKTSSAASYAATFQWC